MTGRRRVQSAQGGAMPDVSDLPHIDGLYGYAMAITRNPVEAEDLVQENLRSRDTGGEKSAQRQ